MRFRPRQRLRQRADFGRVRAGGRRVHCGAFIMQMLHEESSGEEGTRDASQAESVRRRLGVIASRRVGNAVKRNRGKRLIREIFRHHQERLPASCDLVVILQSSFDRCSFQELEERFLAAIERRKPQLAGFRNETV